MLKQTKFRVARPYFEFTTTVKVKTRKKKFIVARPYFEFTSTILKQTKNSEWPAHILSQDIIFKKKIHLFLGIQKSKFVFQIETTIENIKCMCAVSVCFSYIHVFHIFCKP